MTDNNNNVIPDSKVFEPLQPGESVVFSSVHTEGTFRRRKSSEIQITTSRSAIIDYKHPENSYALGLEEIDDVVVFDQKRMSDSGFQMAGTRSRFSYYVGTSKSKGRVMGSIYFISYKYTDIVLNDVSDPTGLSKLVIGLIKQRKAVLGEGK